MNRYQRQNYKDVNPLEVNPECYPITQLKFDGIWCGVESDGTGRLQYYSRNGQLKHEHKTDRDTPAGFYIGEFMYGSEWSTQENRSGKLFLFDVTELKGTGLTREPYHQRYDRLQRLRSEGRLPLNWSIIANYPTLQIDAIWSNLVESGKFEGVVFRHPDSLWATELLRAKLSLTKDLRILDYQEGQGRLAGSLGAIIAIDSTGLSHTIGGGLSDHLRKLIWKDKEKYRGKIIIVEAKKQFASGQLRHPNFLNFHPDKTQL